MASNFHVKWKPRIGENWIYCKNPFATRQKARRFCKRRMKLGSVKVHDLMRELTIVHPDGTEEHMDLKHDPCMIIDEGVPEEVGDEWKMD